MEFIHEGLQLTMEVLILEMEKEMWGYTVQIKTEL